MAWRRSALTVIIVFCVIYRKSASAVPVTVDLYPSDQLHIVQGTPPHHAPPDHEMEYDLTAPLDFAPSPRVIVSEGFPGHRHPHAQEQYAPAYGQAEAGRESVHGMVREGGFEERAPWRYPGSEQQQQGYNYNDGRGNWYPRHGQVNGYRQFSENHISHQHPHPEVWDNGLRRHQQQPQYHQQPQQPMPQQKQEEQRRHGQHNHEETGSHICVDGKCYVIATQAYDASTASDVARQRPLSTVPVKPIEKRVSSSSKEAISNPVKRSTEEVNDVRKRFQQAPQQQYQQQQYQQYQPRPGQQYQQSQQQYQQHQRAHHQPPPQQPQGYKGQGKGDSTRKQQYQKQDKADTQKAPLAKAIIDFEKILDMADEFSYVYPIVRNSYDDVSNILVIELDYSEAPITPEATVETEDD